MAAAAVICALSMAPFAAAQVEDRPWRSAPAEHGVFYQVFVRSFQDSDGDGVGDLQGLRSRLDYIEGMGFTGIWLMPIHPSPSYHGYDVTDFDGVNPQYGSVEDLAGLLDDAHHRGLRVILDYVPNHTSAQHPWFVAAAAGDPAYRDRYVFRADPVPMRGTSGGSAWHDLGGVSYLGLFSATMPDLDHTNPEVVRLLFEVATRWLEFGVDGFRVDAVQHVVEGDDGRIANSEANYAWVADLQEHVTTIDPGAFLVGETWTEMPAIARYHAASGLQASFDYPLWREVTGAILARSASDLAFTLAQAEEVYPVGAVRATFLGNHDQARLATQLSIPRRDERRLKLAASLLLTLPGVPFVYYGEEIGLPDGPGALDVEKRTPMPWDPSEGRGFTAGEPWTDPGEAIPGVTVSEQLADPDSLLWHYRRMIALRRTHPALYRGATEVLDAGQRAVLAVARDSGDERLLVLANLGARDLVLEAAWLEPGLVDVLTGSTFSGSLPGLSVAVLRAP